MLFNGEGTAAKCALTGCPSMATGMGADFGPGGGAGEAENHICVFWGAFVSF